eukprot:jgi/Ulvmu1/11233/UM073_0005.1
MVHHAQCSEATFEKANLQGTPSHVSMAGEVANGNSAAGSKAQLEALLKKVGTARKDLDAASERDSNDLVVALREGEQAQHDLSAWLADFRAVSQAETSSDFLFKVFNLPQWPCGRLKAWLSRNKVNAKDVEKFNSWSHAIITVDTEQAKVRAQEILCSKYIAGVRLGCCEVGEDQAAAKAQTGPRPSKRARPASADNTSQRDKSQRIQHPTGSAAPQHDPQPKAGTDAPAQPKPPAPASAAAARTQLPEDAPDAVRLKDKMCPLWSLPYSEQLKVKLCLCWDAMVNLTRELRQATLQSSQPGWLAQILREHPDGHPCCAIKPILRSPQVNQYRNRADFTIGFDGSGRPVAGHLMGMFREGVTVVAPPDELPMPSPTAIGYATLMSRFLNSGRASLPAWDKSSSQKEASKRGFWRSLAIREGRTQTFFPPEFQQPPAAERTLAGLDAARFHVPLEATAAGASADASARFTLSAEATEACNAPQAAPPDPDEVMVLVQVNMTAASADVTAEELRAWADYARRERPPGLPAPTAFCYHHSELLGHGLPVDATVHPVPSWDGAAMRYSDSLCELTFSLHPHSFFQAASASAALMYHAVATLAHPSATTCLLDLYSGVAPVALALARTCRGAVCVDNAPQNDADARANAAALGITNCTFVRAAAETAIRDVLTSERVTHSSDVVAVINPPRGGVHRNLLYALLDCPKVHRIVYVGSNPDTVVRDTLILVTPARAAKRRHNAVNKGNVKASAPTRYHPFKPVKLVPMDSSPHSSWVDMAVLLER